MSKSDHHRPSKPGTPSEESLIDRLIDLTNPTSFVLIDTPGQIEIFTWSASGAIITDAIASSLPTVVAYIIDTPRTTAPATFMSNMLYACSLVALIFLFLSFVNFIRIESLVDSTAPIMALFFHTSRILYKTRLPFLLVFNKTDVQAHDFALEWMEDFESFQQALVAQNQSNESEGGSGYMSSLMNSMSLVLDEFYKNLRVESSSSFFHTAYTRSFLSTILFCSRNQAVGCSAMTGFGMKEFFEAVDEARQEYEK
jgi:GTPase SAR1 family protein